MRVLRCYPHACLGGGSSYDFRSLSTALTTYNPEIDLHVVIPSPPKVDITKQQYVWNLPFRVMGSSSTYWPDCKQYNNLSDRELENYQSGLHKSLLQLVQTIKPDVIHCEFLLPSGWAVAKIGSEFNIPVIITSHGADLKMMEVDDRYLQGSIQNLKTVKRFVGYSPDHKDWIQGLLPADLMDKVDFIPGGVDTDFYSPTTDTSFIQKQYQVEPRKFVLGVGRFQKRKGFHLLIEAARHFDYPLILIGDGWEMNSLKDQVKEAGLTNVRFLGFMGPDKADILRQFYAAAGVVVLPSLTREETLCFVGLEAMASGAAVIASNVGGLKYILENGKAGLLVEPGNQTKLEAGINKLMESPEIAQNYGKLARKRTETEFTWEKVANKYFDLYKSVR